MSSTFKKPSIFSGLKLSGLDFFRNPRHLWALVLLGAAVGMGLVTFFILQGVSFDTMQSVLWVLLADGVIFFALCILIVQQLQKLWRERRENMAGSKLHVRLSLLFGAVAVTPTIIMAVFSIIFFHFGIQNWFSTKVKTGLSEAVMVAQSYLEEHKNVVARDAFLMAEDLKSNKNRLSQDPARLSEALTVFAKVRSLTEAIIFDEEHKVLGKTYLTFALEFEPIPQAAVSEANKGEVGIVTSKYGDRVRALIKIGDNPSLYLFVGRAVDPKVLGHLKKTEEVVQDYTLLEGRRIGYEWVLTLLFGLVGILLLLVSVWVGLVVASQIIRPIGPLINAAKRIGEGHLDARVDEQAQTDELGSLSKSFNQMATELQYKQTELLTVNQKLDERRRFIEATMARVSAGVMGLNAKGQIGFSNQRASEILQRDLGQKMGLALIKIMPEIQVLLQEAVENPNHIAAVQNKFHLKNGTVFLSLQAVADFQDNVLQGFVVTFDDITDLMQAQKQAAWSDVARRIAHEIKNPLTPIQLSAERLKRKYLPEVKTDPKIFEECINTIVRQVNHIGQMVTEFSTFARMPLPMLKVQDILPICQQVMDLQQQAYPAITFKINMPESPILVNLDAQQMSQALLNLVKNALESIEAKHKQDKEFGGIIKLSVHEEEESVMLEILDNGLGLPEKNIDQLMEPYVTTRAEGTGLGLAIVQKIISDHQGTITLSNRARQSGAVVKIVLPRERS
jgi:two-component system, NtrC family, nitrogen regulation sensor histidine kinase NtrY